MTEPSSAQAAGEPNLVERIAAAMTDLSYRGGQLSSAHALKLAELAWPVVAAALASSEAEVRRKLARWFQEHAPTFPASESEDVVCTMLAYAQVATEALGRRDNEIERWRGEADRAHAEIERVRAELNHAHARISELRDQWLDYSEQRYEWYDDKARYEAEVRQKVAGEVRALVSDMNATKEFLDLYGLTISAGPGGVIAAVAAEISEALGEPRGDAPTKPASDLEREADAPTELGSPFKGRKP